MTIAARVKRFLDQHLVSYRVLNYERLAALSGERSVLSSELLMQQMGDAIEKLNIPAHQVLKAVPISDGLTIILAILPWDHVIDFISIKLSLQAEYHIVSMKEQQALFCDCEKGSTPALAAAYELKVILDKSIESLETVYIEAGSHSSLLELSIDDFRFLNGGAPIFYFAYPGPMQNKVSSPKFKHIGLTFPTLPLQAQKILKLAERLMTTHRPPLLKQESRFFKFAEFDHVALACAAQQVFKLPKETFLGSKAFWKHALYAASLAENLAKAINAIHSNNTDILIPVCERFDPELCYSLGFTHNFGFLLFGHLFLHEYRLLSKWIQQNPKEPIELLEKKLLGMGQGLHVIGKGHSELGAWLMEYWKMPDIFVCVAEHHHDTDYKAAYQNYIALIQLTNHLLNKVGIGKETLSISLQTILELLGLSQNVAEDILAELMTENYGLRFEKMVEDMAFHVVS